MSRYHHGALVSCQVPWDERERVLEDVFRREVRFLRERGFRDLYVFGTAGEGYAVTLEQFRHVTALFADEVLGTDVQVMVGVIGLSTGAVIERVGIAHDLGFRTFQISLPCWGVLDDAELARFVTQVCGAFPDSGFLHYNLPRAGRVLTVSDYRRLVDAVPNLVATKNTGGGAHRALELVEQVPELEHFLGEENYAFGALAGECSLLAGLGAMVPRLTHAYYAAGQRRDASEVLRLQHQHVAILHDVLGPQLAQRRMDGAYDKAILRLGGFTEMPLRLLSPYSTFTPDEVGAAARVLQERYGAWRWPPGDDRMCNVLTDIESSP